MKHAAFADDLGGAGELWHLRRWWDNIVIVDSLVQSWDIILIDQSRGWS
jgi:hypothetical protein